MQIYYAKTSPGRYRREPNVAVGLWLYCGNEMDIANAQVRLEPQGYTIIAFDGSETYGRRKVREIMAARYLEAANV